MRLRLRKIHGLTIAIMCILVATAIVTVYVYAKSYAWVRVRDYVPPSIPVRETPYASVHVWRYTDGVSFLPGGTCTGGDPILKHPYYPGVGQFITYSWTPSFTKVEYRVKIYKLEGNSLVLVCTLRPCGWMWPNGKYGGSYEYSGTVEGGYVK